MKAARKRLRGIAAHMTRFDPRAILPLLDEVMAYEQGERSTPPSIPAADDPFWGQGDGLGDLLHKVILATLDDCAKHPPRVRDTKNRDRVRDADDEDERSANPA